MNKTKLHLYTNTMKDFSYLKGTGILSDERIAELAEIMDEKNFIPVELKNGQKIVDEKWKFHIPTSRVYVKSDYSENYVLEQILSEVLTEEEILTLNEQASREYNSQRDDARFEKAEKIHWRDFQLSDNIIVEDDEIYEDLESFIEKFYCDHLPEDEDFEEWKPSYLWEGEKYPWLNRVGVDQIVETFSDDVTWDYGDPNISGEEELQKALDKFWEENKDIWWGRPTGRVILLDEEFWKEYQN